MHDKLLKKAEECVDRVDSGKRARLDSDERKAMVAEIRIKTGQPVPSERGDAYVAARYLSVAHLDAWSDEARAAALEARRASAKANKTGTSADHQAAANAHSKAVLEKSLSLGKHGMESDKAHDRGLREVNKHAELSDMHQQKANEAGAREKATSGTPSPEAYQSNAKPMGSGQAPYENAMEASRDANRASRQAEKVSADQATRGRAKESAMIAAHEHAATLHNAAADWHRKASAAGMGPAHIGYAEGHDKKAANHTSLAQSIRRGQEPPKFGTGVAPLR